MCIYGPHLWQCFSLTHSELTNVPSIPICRTLLVRPSTLHVTVYEVPNGKIPRPYQYRYYFLSRVVLETIFPDKSKHWKHSSWDTMESILRKLSSFFSHGQSCIAIFTMRFKSCTKRTTCHINFVESPQEVRCRGFEPSFYIINLYIQARTFRRIVFRVDTALFRISRRVQAWLHKLGLFLGPCFS